MRFVGLLVTAAAIVAAPSIRAGGSMPSQTSMTISRVTLATTNMTAMTRFYNEVFAAGLRRTVVGGAVMELGTLAGVELLLCPNEIARVDAALNRHMFRIAVDDVASVLERVRRAGGTVDAPPALIDGRRLAAVRDPDGNTIELTERQR